MTDIDLNFLARQLERLAIEVSSLRDLINVLNAIVMRLDGSQSALLQELHAVRNQISRMNDRIRKLEDSEPGT
jgi:predicted  nucleic acid-binding Zn-ribbon protein